MRLMKSRSFLLIAFFCSAGFFLSAQTTFHDAARFPLLGKITDSTETRYERLSASLRDTCRPRLWQLGKNTSGLALRFRSNTTQVSARWTLLEGVNLNHMTDTGVRGLDLYAWNGKTWQFVNTARPTAKENRQVIISNMLPLEREYLLYLPLYDGLTDLQIGVDSTARIDLPALPLPAAGNPIVCYGTSITQGGCATRAGMSYTNILMRRMNREFVNLGFSGNGKLDYEIAELMAQRSDVALFVLDFIPNVTLEQVKEKTAEFINILRRRHPDVPILLVESVLFTHMPFDEAMRKVVSEKNKALREEYEKLRRQGDRRLHYLPAGKLIGRDGEATVDGIHLTDLGFLRFADELEKEIDKIINQTTR